MEVVAWAGWRTRTSEEKVKQRLRTGKIMDIETTQNFERNCIERVTVSSELKSGRNESKSPRVVR